MSINVYTRPVGQKERQLTNFVKVKRIISRDGAVETRLEKRRPAVAEFVRTAAIRFANASDSRIHRLLLTGQNLLIKKQFPKKKSIATYFSAVHVFDGRFPEREVNVISVGERADKVGSCCCQTGSKDVIYIKKKKKKKLHKWTTYWSNSGRVPWRDARRIVHCHHRRPGPLFLSRPWGNCDRALPVWTDTTSKEEEELPLRLVASYCSVRSGSR